MKGRKAETKQDRLPWKVPAAFLILAATIGVAYVTNMVIAAGFVGASMCWLYGGRRWWFLLLMGLASCLIMYFLFGVFFGVPMEF